ncbi:ABC1 kinase family protein [Paeniglutamicibacter gangotriensis]|uniref:AarF/ABC1/UbiB kinase family protein n=1 Tax=Paeniglutamicibacter gangotriensis TaxID=254787 RepID=A0A5B0E303_9MICC|nr:AarF/ABC1/UbiB kinase family protein [Paeniglutamicibacter gangotriensis]KAA0973048.1 AarF/ABC1/UbiB kinase family protein [Paeniglutamicibacter gangotriensis]
MNTHLERFAQIAEILTRHGLGFLAGALGLERWLPGPAPMPAEEPTTPVRLRVALEELGPTFIKLGQLLSTRSDILPVAYLNELSKLQDAAPPVSAAEIRSLIQQELGAIPERLFASFDDEPLASASIGQAHAATLMDGTEVVVKVRRPGIVARIDEDLEILQNLAARASRRWEAAADYNLTGIATEFADTLRAELDYLREGRNAERFAENFAAIPEIYVPGIFWATTTSRVLTMERIRGIKVDQIEALDHAEINRGEVAQRAARAVAKMIFEDGFFHADPHPGNLFIQPGGRIALIDFGMVGEIDEGLRDQLVGVLFALTSSDPERMGSALRAISVTRPTMDQSALRRDCARFIQLYKGLQLREVKIAPLVTQMLAILRNHHLQLPRDMALLLKMVLMAEGMGVRLDPEFSLGEILRPYAKALAQARFSPRNLAERLGKAGLEAAELGMILPEKLRTLLENMDGGVEVHLRAAELEPLVGRVERIGNRLVAGMIAAAFIRGIGELTAADRERLRTWQNPLLGAGLGAAGSLGAYLAWTARRRKYRGPR